MGIPDLVSGVVEEHSCTAEVGSVRAGGGARRENVGMSSKNRGENPRHRKPKVSWATIIDPGLGGPNRCSERSRGMEKQVNIPVPPHVFKPPTHSGVRSRYGYTCFCFDLSRRIEADPSGEANSRNSVPRKSGAS